MSSDFLHELAALSSIYPPSTLVPSPPSADIYILALPSQPLSLRLSIPAAYPATPPEIVGTQHIGAGLQKGYGTYVLEIARRIVKRTWRQGEVCLFELMEELESGLGGAEEREDDDEQGVGSGREGAVCERKDRGRVHEGGDATEAMEVPPAWIASEVVKVKRSVFVARAVKVDHPAMAKSYLAHLLATDRKVGKATHNISAYRIREPTGLSSADGDKGRSASQSALLEMGFQECDSDGEDAAGGRLLYLLRGMGVWDVLVVVSRWYGGVKLGADRFRVMNCVAREAVVRWGAGKRDGDTS